MDNKTIRKKAVQTAKDIALDDRHGYSQLNRQGPDYDCSSLVLYCYASAGANINGATYTGNMRQLLTAAGWECISPAPGVKKLKAGDILLNDLHHTAIYVGDGNIVEAFGDELGGIGRGAKTGDQTGKEIRLTPYYNFSAGWNCVLRLPDAGAQAPALDAFCTCSLPVIRKGDVSPATCAAQAALNYHGYGWINPDGVFGPATETAVINFQRKNGLDTDGVIGPNTWPKLMTWRN